MRLKYCPLIGLNSYELLMNFTIDGRNLLSVHAIPWRMIFCSSLMLLTPGTFPKFWSISSLISTCIPTITTSLCPHSPRSCGFNHRVFVFQALFNDFRQGVSVVWYYYIYKFATIIIIIIIIINIIINILNGKAFLHHCFFFPDPSNSKFVFCL